MATTLNQFSNDIAALVESAGKSTVRVEGRPRQAASGIVWAEGVVVTAHHVLEMDENIRLGLPDGKTADATLAGRDPSTDLAVLKTTATGLAAATWADPAALKIGQFALAVGRPGESLQASLGMINSLGGEWRTPMGGMVDRFIQADFTMYPGFSGGPLVGSDGKFIGLNTSGLLRRMDVTLTAPTLRRVVDALLAHGRVMRGYLGVGSQPARLPATLAQSLGQETGLLIVSVEPESPADRAGIVLGDTIIGIGGSPVQDMDDLMAALSADRVNTQVPVKLIRGGETKEIPVVVGERK